MTLQTARIWIFLIWVAVFLAYEGLILSQLTVPGFSSPDVHSMAWRMAYIMVPVLSAFASFWFMPDGNLSRETEDDNRSLLQKDRIIALFVCTLLVHLIVFCYILFFVRLHTFSFVDDPADSYAARMEWALNFFLFISSIAIIPAGFLLRNPSLKRFSDSSPTNIGS